MAAGQLKGAGLPSEGWLHDLTSRMLNVEGYRKKNETKLSTQTSSWTPSSPRTFQRGVPEYL